MLWLIIVLVLPTFAALFLARRLVRGEVRGGWFGELAAAGVGVAFACWRINAVGKAMGSGADASVIFPIWAGYLFIGTLVCCLIWRRIARRESE